MENHEVLCRFRRREYAIEVTLQSGDYKGAVLVKMRGYGIPTGDIIISAVQLLCEGEYEEENPINLEFCEGEDCDGDEAIWFTCTLTNERGDKNYIEMELNDLSGYIVKVELVDYTDE